MVTFTANQRRLAANRSQAGARPPREGSALLQGVVLCGHCGTGMGVYYSSAQTAHYRCRSRLDQTHTPGCRSVSAALVDPTAVELIRRRKNENMRDSDIAIELHALGLRTAHGHEFTIRDVRNVRTTIGLVRPSPLEPGELTVRDVAARLGVSTGTIYYWLRIGQISYRQPATGALCIPFTPNIEAELRARPAIARLITRNRTTATGGAIR